MYLKYVPGLHPQPAQIIDEIGDRGWAGWQILDMPVEITGGGRRPKTFVIPSEARNLSFFSFA